MRQAPGAAGAVFRKRRRPEARFLIPPANLYLRLCEAGVEVLEEAHWLDFEMRHWGALPEENRRAEDLRVLAFVALQVVQAPLDPRRALAREA